MKVIKALKTEGTNNDAFNRLRIAEGVRATWSRSNARDGGGISPELRVDIYRSLCLFDLPPAVVFDEAFLTDTRVNLRAARSAIRSTCTTGPEKCENEAVMKAIDEAVVALDLWLKILKYRGPRSGNAGRQRRGRR